MHTELCQSLTPHTIFQLQLDYLSSSSPLGTLYSLEVEVVGGQIGVEMAFQVLVACFVVVIVFLCQLLRVSFNIAGSTSEPAFDENPMLHPPEVLSSIPVNVETKRFVLSTQSVSPKQLYEWSPRPYEPNPRPKINEIVDGWDVVGDPQWLLNFAISAFPKCGTSTLMHYFSKNSEVHIHKDERCDLGSNQHARLIKDIYSDFPTGDFVRGIKCPRDVENKLALTNYARFFPKTDMIVGIRHPVKWFESFYNHRIQNNVQMLSISQLIGACSKNGNGVCTNRAGFHVNLAMLGKTRQSKAERALMPLWGQRYLRKYNLTGRVFLYEVDQLNDKNETRARQFRKDLQKFLHLRNELPPMVWFKPGRKDLSQREAEERNAKKINICDPEHAILRKVLMGHARNGSQWIRTFFLPSKGVHVSSPDHFTNLLERWNIDPCRDGGSYKLAAAALNCTKYGCFIDSKAHV